MENLPWIEQLNPEQLEQVIRLISNSANDILDEWGWQQIIEDMEKPADSPHEWKSLRELVMYLWLGTGLDLPEGFD